MKKVTFECDFCHEIVRYVDTKINFVGVDLGKMEVSHYNEAECHICYRCIDKLIDIFCDIKSKGLWIR